MKIEEIAVGDMYAYQNKILVVQEENMALIPHILSELRPFPISAERLIKLGFEPHTANSFYKTFGSGRTVILSTLKYENWSVRLGSIGRLQYIHQLQQLCRAVYKQHLYKPDAPQKMTVIRGIGGEMPYYLTWDTKRLYGTNPDICWRVGSSGTSSTMVWGGRSWALEPITPGVTKEQTQKAYEWLTAFVVRYDLT